MIINNTHITIEMRDNKPFINSLEVAKVFEKRHGHVIDSIEDLYYFDKFTQPILGLSEKDDKFSQPILRSATKGNTSKIKEVSYTDEQDKLRKAYLLDRDVFLMIALAFRGKRYLDKKTNQIIDSRKKYEEYRYSFIQLFNELEQNVIMNLRAENKDLLKQLQSTDIIYTKTLNNTMSKVNELNRDLRHIEQSKNVSNGKNIVEVKKHILKTDNEKGLSSPRQIYNRLQDLIPVVNEYLEQEFFDLMVEDGFLLRKPVRNCNRQMLRPANKEIGRVIGNSCIVHSATIIEFYLNKFSK